MITSLKSNLPVSVFVDEEEIEDIIGAYYDEVFIMVKDVDKIEYKNIYSKKVFFK